VDKLFYNAGVACKKANDQTMAFLLLNRYLDIFEVIEDPDNNGNLADQGEFAHTDIPNLFDVYLPEANLISDSDKQQLSKAILISNFR
jgi:intraflagellar transport protein 172